MCGWGRENGGGSGAEELRGLGATTLAAHRTTPYVLPPPPADLQPRAGCGTRYLGASAANCTNQLVALYNKADTAALTLWQLIPVA